MKKEDQGGTEMSQRESGTAGRGDPGLRVKMRSRVDMPTGQGQGIHKGIHKDRNPQRLTLAGASLMPQLHDGHLILHSMLEPPSLTAEGSLREVGLSGRTMAHPTLGHDSFSIWR